jgi:hypothetical protein
MSETLISHTGELVDLTQAPAEVIGRIAQDFEGRRSLEVDGWKFETTAPEERDIDVLGLQLVLTDLVREGTISQAKADRVITWTPKVVWAELKSLTTDPRCQARVNHTISMRPAARYGKVKRG